MPNVRASSGTIGTTSLPISSLRSIFASILTKTIVVEAFRFSVPLSELVEDVAERRLQGGRGDHAPRDEAAEGVAALQQVLRLAAALGRSIERRVGDAVVGDRHAEPVAEGLQIGLVHLLLLMGDVLAFTRLAKSVAFDGARENDGWPAGVRDRRAVCVVDLDRIVAAHPQPLQVVVREVAHHVEQPWIGAPEMLAQVGAVFDRVPLVLTVDDLGHALDEQTIGVAGEEPIPIRSPQHLNDVPSGAAEIGFELLDDLAVAAHRPIEPLQIAVDDEDQVVELLARGQ